MASDNSFINSVERELLDESFDSLETLTDRKRVLGDPLRYAILYTVHADRQVTKTALREQIGDTQSDTAVADAVDELVRVNLIARIPGPPGADDSVTKYRITTLGRQAIESDEANIHGDRDQSSQ